MDLSRAARNGHNGASNMWSRFYPTTWIILVTAPLCEAWLPSGTAFSRKLTTRVHLSSSEPNVSLSSTNDNEDNGPNAPRTLLPPEEEEQYAVADGAYLEKFNNLDTDMTSNGPQQENRVLPSNSSSDTDTIDKKDDLEATMERMTQKRSYPLFLAEKAAELVESTVADAWSKTGLSALTTPATGAKERVVVLGTGWGSACFLQAIDTNLFDVTVISPRNHFTFTPLLAGASVGTVSAKSICEPVRELNSQATFVEAVATSIDPDRRTLQCQRVNCSDKQGEEFSIEYDRLVVTVGAQTNTFGIPGVRENCYFLRQVEDARRIRRAIVNCFEKASLPEWSDEERNQLLTFAVIGAGPTGIEFAAELRDFVEQEVPRYYPELLRHVQIKVIAAGSTVLRSFDKSLQEEAIRQFTRSVEIQNLAVRESLPERFKLTELLLESSVEKVDKDTISLSDGMHISYGLAVFAAGNGPLPVTLQLIDSLGDEQNEDQGVARGRLAVDPWMRVLGSEGNILALGDCSCITADQLPATAQVASQQGEYLAKLMNKRYELSPPRSQQGIFPPPRRHPARTDSTVSDVIASFALDNNEYAKPFQFLNLGILAYSGNGSALAQVTALPDSKPLTGTGLLGNIVWRSVYLSKQLSLRNGLLVANDWTKQRIFGRDLNKL